MKTQDYNLGNEEFASFVNRAADSLRKIGIPYAFVGGTAVQAQTLRRLCKIHDADVSTLALNRYIRFQDYIRSTDDVDMALLFPDNAQNNNLVKDVVDKLCNSLVGVCLSKDEEHIFEYSLERSGISRPVFKVFVDDNQGKNISLNISKQSRHLRKLGFRFYDKFIEEAEEFHLPYSRGLDLRIRTYKPLHILATKISQFRAKDSMDIANLERVIRESGEDIDEEELRDILLPVHVDQLLRFNSLTGRYVDSSYVQTNS